MPQMEGIYTDVSGNRAILPVRVDELGRIITTPGASEAYPFTLLANAAAPVTGASLQPLLSQRTYQATVEGSGAVSADVSIEVSEDSVHWISLASISLSGTGVATDGFTSAAPWKYVRARLTAISGTSAAVNVIGSASV